MQKSLSNSENERRVIVERLEASQQGLGELRRNNQILQDQIQRLNTELANNEVQKAGLESQLRLSQWPVESPISSRDDDLLRQLHSTQRERSELRGKVDSLTNKVSFSAKIYNTKIKNCNISYTNPKSKSVHSNDKFPRELRCL